MKETAIIYCRKSTDRDDRQQNSLDHQLINCKNTVEKNNLLVLDEIVESASAKTGTTRAGFNRMIEACRTGKVDYIVVDESKRLGRNIIDASVVIDLMDRGVIKGIHTTDKFFDLGSSEKFMLLLELGISKMENEHRSKDVQEKMMTAMNKGRWMSMAIFGYENKGPRGNRDIFVVEEEADLVRRAFIMRTQKRTLREIADYLGEQTGKKWSTTRISTMITNTRYWGLQKFGKHEAMLDSPGYRPIVSKELFDSANSITGAVKYDKDKEKKRYLAGLIRDEEGNKLYPYEAKGNTYYHNGKKSKERYNISEKLVYKLVEEQIHLFDFPKPFVQLSKATLKTYYHDKVVLRKNELTQITKDLTITKDRLESLVEKFLDNKVDSTTYEAKKSELEMKKEGLEQKYKAHEQGDTNILSVIEKLCELVENLSTSYKQGNEQKKGQILRAMQCELRINNKKELVIKENKLFQMIRGSGINEWCTPTSRMRTIYEMYDYIEKHKNEVQEITKDLGNAIHNVRPSTSLSTTHYRSTI